MRFIEETETAWSAEQLAAAEREIEEQKREWEENRLAAMREEEKRRARELEEEADLLTFSREDATNQVSKTKKVINRRSNKIVKRVKVVKKNTPDIKNKVKKVSESCTESDVDGVVKRNKGKARGRVAKRNKEAVEPDSTTQSSVSDDTETVKVNGDDSNSKWSCDSEMEVNTNTESDADSDLIPLAKKRITSNHIDHNSPRTRSHGTVAINLWTLDVSPILPGVKPIIKSSATSSVIKRERSRNSSSEKEIDVETVDKNKKNNNSLTEKKKTVRRKLGEIVGKKRGRAKKISETTETNSNDSVNSIENETANEGEKHFQEAVNVCKEKVCKVVIQDVMTTVDATKYLPKNNNKNVDITDNLDQETEVEIAKADVKTNLTPNTSDGGNKKRKNFKNCNNSTLDGWLQKSRDKDDIVSGNSINRTSNNEPNEN